MKGKTAKVNNKSKNKSPNTILQRGEEKKRKKVKEEHCENFPYMPRVEVLKKLFQKIVGSQQGGRHRGVADPQNHTHTKKTLTTMQLQWDFWVSNVFKTCWVQWKSDLTGNQLLHHQEKMHPCVGAFAR